MAPLIWRKSSHSGSNGGDCVEVALPWRKSSYSTSNNGDCVEVAFAWYKSSHSGSNNGNCVEVAASDQYTAVRDSKAPHSGMLTVPPAAWHAFTRVLRNH
ncbi:DUF397 domain-containing protein [Amycolatopsis sp. NPDC059027]|uniref:DUF397 domain-containing protein n=1 Tax=unclassified Amycolatopsis TaxID=2618356 RepID=UPI00367114F9